MRIDFTHQKNKLNCLKKHYIGIKKDQRWRAVIPFLVVADRIPATARDSLVPFIAFLGLASLSISIFTVPGYYFLGHTNKNRAQPIEELLSLIEKLENTHPVAYKQFIPTLDAIEARITAKPSRTNSAQYQELINTVAAIRSKLEPGAATLTALCALNRQELANFNQTPVGSIVHKFLNPASG